MWPGFWVPPVGPLSGAWSPVIHLHCLKQEIQGGKGNKTQQSSSCKTEAKEALEGALWVMPAPPKPPSHLASWHRDLSPSFTSGPGVHSS